MENGELTQSQVDDLVARYPLPDGVEDVVLNREELADALDTSLNTITAWIGQGMPVAQTGGNGKPYELRLSHCHAWRQAQKANEDLRNTKARAAIAAMRLALVGGKNGESIEALDPKSRREILAVQMEQERFSAQRKQLMRREDVTDLVENLLRLIRDMLETMPDRLDRSGLLPAKSADAVIDLCDQALVELDKRIRRFWEVNSEDRTPAKQDLFDA